MNSITASRFFVADDPSESMDERDALVEVEVGDPHANRGIDLHLSPRTDDTVTCSLSPDEAWRLCRELARAAGYVEDQQA